MSSPSSSCLNKTTIVSNPNNGDDTDPVVMVSHRTCNRKDLSSSCFSTSSSTVTSSDFIPHNKRVRFCNAGPQIVWIENARKLSKRQLKDRWWREKDFMRIRDDTTEQASFTAANRLQETEDCEWTARGLERHTMAGVQEYLKHHDAAVLAVLREQQKAKERRETREKAEKGIANAYRLETKSSLKRARLQGICDEREIREYTKDVDVDTLLLAQRKEMSVKRSISSELKLLRFFRQLTTTTTNNPNTGEYQQ
jgi:hypothetical protein